MRTEPASALLLAVQRQPPARTAAALARFAFEHSAPDRALFNQWPEAVLKEYFAFHLLHGTVGWTQTRGLMTGLGIIWQAQETQVRAAGKFDWTPTDPKGDSLVFAEFITLHPPARRALLRHFAHRFPMWRTLKLFAFRRGRIEPVPVRAAERLLTL